MPSKTAKKNSKKCQYKIQRGEKKGQKCGRPCQGKFYCFAHTEKNLNYQKNYNIQRNDEDKEKNLAKKIRQIEKGKCLPPNVEKLRKKMRDIFGERFRLRSEGFGCMMKLDPKFVPPIKQWAVNEMNDAERVLQTCIELYESSNACTTKVHRHKFWDNLSPLEQEEYISKYKRDYLSRAPRMYAKPFKGNIAEAKKKLKSLRLEESRFNAKIIKYRKLIAAVEKLNGESSEE